MRDLMVAVLLAPVLCWLIRKTHGAVVILLGILYLLSVQSFIPGMGRTTLFFFGIGAWFALRKENFAQCVEKHKWWTVPIWALLMCVCVYFDGANTDTGLIFHAPMVVVGVFAFIGIVSARQKRILLRPAHEPTTPTLCGRIIDFAASNTFFIYVAHNLFGLHITTIVLKRIPFPPLVSYLLTPFLAIAICLAVLWLMRKIIPRTTAVLVGERRRP